MHIKQDPYYNCYAQVLGRKRVWLAAPTAGTHMYAHGSDHLRNDEEDGLATSYATNTSKVPVFSPDRRSFPEFMTHVEPVSMEAILEPGDMLFIPPGWWHAMRGEGSEVAWSVSMWF